MSELTFQDPKKKFCEHLRATRESKEMDLSRIAERTKISLYYLEHLESGEWDFLPHAYVRAFLRTYAQIIGLDVNKTLDQFDNIVDEPPVPLPGALGTGERERVHESRKPKKKKKPGRNGEEEKPAPKFTMALDDSSSRGSREGDSDSASRMLYWGIGAIFVLAVILLISFWPRTPSTTNTEEIPFEEVVREHEEMVQDQGEGEAVEGSEEGATSEASDILDVRARLLLIAEATERCYIRVTADRDTMPMEDVVLDPGMTRKYEADSLLIVVLGNAGGMRLNFDGQDLGVLGEQGRVVTAIIGPEGLRRVRRGVLRAPTPPSTNPPTTDIPEDRDLTRPTGAARATFDAEEDSASTNI